MDFWPEFRATSWGKEFIAGGFGGMAGIIAGYPLDTLRIRLQNSNAGGGSAFGILRNVITTKGPGALYRGMGAPLASVAFQNAMVFQIYAILSRSCDSSLAANDPPSYKGVALGGSGTGAIQSLLLTPVELVKIRLQLQLQNYSNIPCQTAAHGGPMEVVKSILKLEGLRGLYRGLAITTLRDAPSYGFYFWTYEYMREKLHPGCRKNNDERFRTMLIAGGLAGVASWVCCYPLDVIKTRLQAQSPSSLKYKGIIDCFRRSVKQDGHSVLFRGLGTAVTRAFVVNGTIFTAYETAVRCLFNNNGHSSSQIEKPRVQTCGRRHSDDGIVEI
ncbi:Mitochondrial substrate/solute carrier [Dillenia turbinata]|uniref:Mitochondrial substrate/solute carrier n=1 Tax=Dillenia turbinata TaxID=194707 RepID=A0AAN8UB44_9MAGN